MEPGDWKYAVVIAVMVASLGLVAVSVPRMDEAERRFVAEMKAYAAAQTREEASQHLAAASQAERDRLAWGSFGTLGALVALVALLSIFFIGVRGPMGRGGMSRQAARKDGERDATSRPSGGAGRSKSGRKASKTGGTKVG